ncbi:Flp family type IVb pilin [Vibrio sp. UBA2437]|uniref:Flp family type IVb pilin n=1 Tax=Vibrio sp. F74 TaxID=700020 RepID=UPI0032645F6A
MFLSTYVKTKLFLEEFKNDERGVTAIEYAIVGVAIATIVALAFGSDLSAGLGLALKNALSTIATKM